MVKVFEVVKTGSRDRRLVPVADPLAPPEQPAPPPKPKPPPVDVSGHSYSSACERRITIDRQLSGMAKLDPRRPPLVAEAHALASILPLLRDAQKAMNTKRNFAGLTSPLAEAVAARFDAATVAELEVDALSRLEAREKLSAARRAEKEAKKVNGTK